MKLLVDALDSHTGWSTSDSSKIAMHTSVNQIPEYIAGGQTGSIIIHLKSGGVGAYVTKTLASPITVSPYDTLVFSVYSVKSKNIGINSFDPDLFLAKIDFNATMTPYMVPVYDSLTPVTLSLSGITTLTRIRVTSNTNRDEYLVLSYMVISKDEIPADIYIGMKAQIESVRDERFNNAFFISKVTAVAGDTSVYLASNKYIDKYACIYITGGGHSEIHQIKESTERDFTFLPTYSGEVLLYNYTAADVYLYIPVEFSQNEFEFISPGISIEGMAPRPFYRGGKIEKEYDSLKSDGTITERLNDLIVEWTIEVACEARTDDMLAVLSEIVRVAIAREFIWVNGYKLWIFFSGDPQYIDSPDAVVQLPKVVYTVKVEIKENIWPRSSIVPAIDFNPTVVISEQGGIL